MRGVRVAVVAALAVGAAVAVPQAAQASAPPSTASNIITVVLPPQSTDQTYNIFGSFSGLRPGEAITDVNMWVSCEDHVVYTVTLTSNGVHYPDGSLGGQLYVSLPASEQGHACSIQSGGFDNRMLVFNSSGWRQFLGNWVLDLSGYAVTAVPHGHTPY